MIICFSSISYFSKIDRQREFDVRLRELKQGLCDNLAMWDGEGDGMEGGGMGVPTDKKKEQLRNSLVLQWLRLCASTAGGMS